MTGEEGTMTSRAGQAPLGAHEDDSYGGCVICREYVPHTDEEMVQVPFPCPTVRLARAQQEVRDDIRAQVDGALAYIELVGDPLLKAHAQTIRAAISSSSATETQDRCPLCGRTDKHAHYPDDPVYATENRHESATPVGTQDGERRYCAVCGVEERAHWDSPPGHPEHDFTAAPTPDMGQDDRDREVERIDVERLARALRQALFVDPDSGEIVGSFEEVAASIAAEYAAARLTELEQDAR